MFPRHQVIGLLRDAAEFWWFKYRSVFRNADHSVNFPAVRQRLLATCGVINAVPDDQKPIARHFQLLPDNEKSALVDDALSVYGFRSPSVRPVL